MDECLQRVAELVARRNAIDAEIAAITQRPVVAGHLGEWIAAKIFEIDLERSAAARAIDGRFTTGHLAGSTVNVKLYGKREGLLDMSEDPSLEYYLVLTGPAAPAMSSAGGTRPLVISSVYLFDAAELLASCRHRGVKIGIATSVPVAAWTAAEIFPCPNSPALRVSPEQHRMLELFAGRT
jgi:hypothetical protein